jgi:hypothetical protein
VTRSIDLIDDAVCARYGWQPFDENTRTRIREIAAGATIDDPQKRTRLAHLLRSSAGWRDLIGDNPAQPQHTRRAA